MFHQFPLSSPPPSMASSTSSFLHHYPLDPLDLLPFSILPPSPILHPSSPITIPPSSPCFHPPTSPSHYHPHFLLDDPTPLSLLPFLHLPEDDPIPSLLFTPPPPPPPPPPADDHVWAPLSSGWKVAEENEEEGPEKKKQKMQLSLSDFGLSPSVVMVVDTHKERSKDEESDESTEKKMSSKRRRKAHSRHHTLHNSEEDKKKNRTDVHHHPLHNSEDNKKKNQTDDRHHPLHNSGDNKKKNQTDASAVHCSMGNDENAAIIIGGLPIPDSAAPSPPLPSNPIHPYPKTIHRKQLTQHFYTLRSLLPNLLNISSQSQTDRCLLIDKTCEYIRTLERKLRILKKKASIINSACKSRQPSVPALSDSAFDMIYSPHVKIAYTNTGFININVGCYERNRSLFPSLLSIIEKNQLDVLSANLSRQKLATLYTIHVKVPQSSHPNRYQLAHLEQELQSEVTRLPI